MYRLRLALLTAFLAGISAGCSEDQPNAPATPTDASKPDFAKKTSDMMKEANKGMDPSKPAAK
jgi:hypothetical protein